LTRDTPFLLRDSLICGLWTNCPTIVRLLPNSGVIAIVIASSTPKHVPKALASDTFITVLILKGDDFLLSKLQVDFNKNDGACLVK